MQIFSFAYPKHCIDTFDRKTNIGLFDCADTWPLPETQTFTYTPFNEIRTDKFFWSCWDAFKGENQTRTTINLADCHYDGGNQHFTFDPVRYIDKNQKWSYNY